MWYQRIWEMTDYVIFDITTSKLDEMSSPLRNLYQSATAVKPFSGMVNNR
jgi:hypothetical protein